MTSDRETPNVTSPTYAEALRDAGARLAAQDTGRLDAELLLAAVLDRPRSHLLAWPERPLTAEQARRFAALVTRRAAGEPIAHILGRREFWSLDLEITPDTLIPRPETELLVERALARIPPAAAVSIVDLGTGTGAIALALACERPHASVTATDRAPEALAVAERNARRLGLSRVRFVLGAWYAPFPDTRFDLILSNPPYIAAADPHLGRGDVRFEPASALVAGADGLDALRAIVSGAPAHLHPGGWLLVEHGYDQAAAVAALFREAGFAGVQTLRDLGGHPRVTEGRWGPAAEPPPVGGGDQAHAE